MNEKWPVDEFEKRKALEIIEKWMKEEERRVKDKDTYSENEKNESK
ncbi:hypothetical protein GCM10010912_59950 [Paenibacillus albidus]|uniref:Uncharacterized protein n=1 Tax=Paenibacillus albidus TaxID=2041023 RepID=A0A917D4I2_9BACL|nr:hypothetical protein [Paenibacillus albidus]GGG07288.1 hypothetical protein GCM10010912_59950 [Paenibacillus albidus]